MNPRERRKSTVALLFVVVVAIVGSLTPGHAAVEWNCRFDPPGGTVFDFDSVAGLGNDTLRIRGGGLCTSGPVNVCGVGPSRLPCNLFGRVRSAVITGNAAEGPGANTLHFGRCDEDPAPPPAPLPIFFNPLIATIDVTINIAGGPTVTRRAVWEVDPFSEAAFCTPYSCSFPGPIPQRADLFRDASRDGSLNLSTRIGGRCPPMGNDTANLLDVRFTA